MTGGRSPKRKGTLFERELVNWARTSGLDARRAYASNGESLGHAAEVDVVVAGKRLQAKRRACVANWLQVPPECDAVAVRADGCEPLVVITYWEWLNLVKEARND